MEETLQNMHVSLKIAEKEVAEKKMRERWGWGEGAKERSQWQERSQGVQQSLPLSFLHEALPAATVLPGPQPLALVDMTTTVAGQ